MVVDAGECSQKRARSFWLMSELDPVKTSGINLDMQEQIVHTEVWKEI